MDYRITLLILPVVIVTALVVATSGSPVDVVSAGHTDVLELETTPKSEGVYAKVGETGEIEIILTEENSNLEGEGFNPEAITNFGPVFIVQNVLEEDTITEIWIEHDSQAVEFYADRCGTCIDSRDEAVRLRPGESVMVALRVDTRGVDDDVLLSGITVMAELDPPLETDKGEGGKTDDSQSVANKTMPMETSSLTETATPTTPSPADGDQVSETTEESESTATESDEPESQETAGIDVEPFLAGVIGAICTGVMVVYAYRRFQ